MNYKFNAHGHPNILATHKSTLEFTKDEELSLNGDCIIGVNADFELGKINDFIKNAESKKIKITIQTTMHDKKISETVNAELNPSFCSDKELVIRKTNFVSERTFGIKANKAAFDINRQIMEFLRKKENKITIIIENKQ